MKRLAATLLAGVMLLSMAACGQKAEDFDASGYVQGVLDAQFHGEYAAHAEDVGESEEDVKKELRETQLQQTKDQMQGSNIAFTDEELQTYVDMIEEGYKKIEYTVKEAKKDENDNFTVDVEVTPLGLWDNFESILTTKMTDAASNGGLDESGYMTLINEALKESIDQAQAYDPVTVTLNVTFEEDKDGNHVYSVNESDLSNLDMIATHQN